MRLLWLELRLTNDNKRENMVGKKKLGKKDILLIPMSLNSHSNASFNERFFFAVALLHRSLLLLALINIRCAHHYLPTKSSRLQSCRFCSANFRFFSSVYFFFRFEEAFQWTHSWSIDMDVVDWKSINLLRSNRSASLFFVWFKIKPRSSPIALYIIISVTNSLCITIWVSFCPYLKT